MTSFPHSNFPFYPFMKVMSGFSSREGVKERRLNPCLSFFLHILPPLSGGEELLLSMEELIVGDV